MDVTRLISELLSEREDVERDIFRLERSARLRFGAANGEQQSVTAIDKGPTSRRRRRNLPATVSSNPQWRVAGD